MVFLHRLLIVVFLLSATTACAAKNSYVELKGQRFSVELAETREKQALGLMFRDSMPLDHGMLFTFPNEALRSFWMKNTLIPLDIIYFSEELELVSVANAKPCRVQQCPAYPSTGPAKYVLELNSGLASELGLEAGDVMTLDLH
jgi:uncharacterized membrane protein (UPF0127 family)